MPTGRQAQDDAPGNWMRRLTGRDGRSGRQRRKRCVNSRVPEVKCSIVCPRSLSWCSLVGSKLSPGNTSGRQGAADVTARKLCQVLAMSLRTTSAKLGLEASGGVVGEAVLTDGGCNQLGNVRWRQSRCSDSTQCSIFTGKTRADERQTRHLQQSSVNGVALTEHSALSQQPAKVFGFANL